MPQNHRDPFDDYEDDDDAGYLTFDARDDEDNVRRGPIILVAILFLLAVFGAILWVYFVGGKSSDDEPPAISASNDSYKEAQLNDIGVVTNEVGNSVYGTSEGAAPPPLEVEAISPSEEPIVPANSVATPVTTPSTQTKATPPRPVTATTPAPKVAEKKTAPAPAPAPKAATPAPKAAPAPVSSQQASAAPKAAPSASAPATSTGSHAAQLGSFSTKAAADTALNNYRSTGLTGPVSVVAANLGAKGTWYRIRATGFESRAQVVEFCQKARAAGANCIPAN